MHLLILGGSLDHLGGVEAFCERSMQALQVRNPGWRMSRIPTSSAYLTLRRLPNFIKGLASLVRYRRQKPDCVWLQYVNLPDLSYLVVARLLGLRVMVTPHLGSNWRSQSNPLLRNLSGWLLGLADRLALISKTQELEIKLPADVPRSLIRNFLPASVLAADPPRSGAPAAAIQLIHSGRLSEGKGTFLFVDVCERLRAAGMPFFARITGGADEATYARLNARIADYGLQDQVVVLGRVPDADLLDLLRASDMLIHLSRIDSYPLIVLEAMTCAMLPVCMELAGARDMVETYGGYVVSSAGAVQETVALLAKLDLEELRARARVAAGRVRSDYSWGNCAGALEGAVLASMS
jgi:glycosyltransferase involved in cell wall biosynthesis